MPYSPDPVGVPLAHYLAQGDAYGVRFSCKACQDSRDVPTSDVVAGLKATGLGDESTGIRALARLARKPCRRCGRTAWHTAPALGPRPRQGIAAPKRRASP